jgi:penicillin-binding protein 1A
MQSSTSTQGFDPEAVLRALVNNIRGAPLQGGSTITQQLTKLNYTDGQRTIMRKFREVLYASRLEQRYSKDELLERYINQVYFGDNAYGLGAASRIVFGIAPEALTPAQAATLAARIRAPEYLDPHTRVPLVKKRRDQVLRKMHERGWLEDQELALATRSPIGAMLPSADRETATKAPHFVELVKREALQLDALGPTAGHRRQALFTGGYTIETTIDMDAFEAAAATVRAMLPAADDPEVAIVSIEPGDGAIRMLFGARDAGQRFDMASQGRRQPGSSFKPFVYLAALRAGIDPRATRSSESPMTVDCRGEPWTVRNFEGGGGGARSIDDALTHSINTVFAQLVTEVSATSVAHHAGELGIDSNELRDPQCAIALGGLTHGVTPLEQAAAFATFAAKGVYAAPYAIERIVDRDGDVIYQSAPETRQPMSAAESGVLNVALQRVVTNGTGGAAAVGRPVAGKTGTTENHGNAWFIGYVPQLSTAVWVGHPEGDVRMTSVHGAAVTGGALPARMFAHYMRAAIAGLAVMPLFHASPDDLSLGARFDVVGPAPISPSTTSAPRATTSTAPAAPARTTTTLATPVTTTTTTTTTAPAPP